MPLVQNSFTHPHPNTSHAHPNTPISTPSDLHANLISTSTDSPTHHHHHHPALTHIHNPPTHTHPTPHPTHITHTHPDTPNTKISTLKFFFSKSHSVNSLCPCIWIGTNLDWVSFEKLTGFQGIYSVLSLGFIFSFLISYFYV